MIAGLAAAMLMGCIPMVDADRFGDMRFDERIELSDERFVVASCDEDGCTGHDRSGVMYRHNGGRFLQKIIDGPGPSAAFADRLRPQSDDSRVLTAAVCVEDGGMWLTLDLTRPERPVYGLFAQP